MNIFSDPFVSYNNCMKIIFEFIVPVFAWSGSKTLL